jgi:hypothetical protein
MLSGIYYHFGEKMRFMTLTSVNDMKRSLEDSFYTLHKRMIRVKPIDFFNEGYLSEEYLRDIFPDESLWFDPVGAFDYIKIKTSEGVSGVFHILFFGFYYPKGWLQDNWYDITGSAYIVDIRESESIVGDADGLAGYCIEQYTAGQSEFISFSTSKNWCFPGYVKVWNSLKRRYTYMLDEPVDMGNFILYKWTDTDSCIEGFKSIIDEYAYPS